MRDERSGSAAGLGIALIATGAVFFAVQTLGLDLGRYGWPLIVIGIGALILLMAMAGVDPSRGLIFPGAIITTVGLILLYQNSTGHWESWVYAWALIPAASGLATALHAGLTGRPERARGGLSAAFYFAILFALGFAFFEGVLRISGRDFGDIGRSAFPALLILLGVWLLVRRLPARERRAP